MKKILFIVIDGLGDEPIPQLGNRTPLEAAFTPNLDFLAKEGMCGEVLPNFYGAIPTSEETHLSLFGYDPKKFPVRRGLFTALGAGIEVKPGDVALRGNLATVDKELNVINRRAGRIENPEPLIEALQKIKFENVNFLVKSAMEHRLGIVMRAQGLSPQISDSDPFYSKLETRTQKIIPLDKSREADFAAQSLNRFLEKAHHVLTTHPFNKQRRKKRLLPANYVLTRGASGVCRLPSFKEKYGLRAACIAGKFLYQQIGKILGMEVIKVKGATGLVNTSLEGKIKAVRKGLGDFDFVFLHIKATDSLAEDGNFQGKKDFIEKIDKSLKTLLGLKDTLIVVTCDHSTCSLVKRHCKKPCPILIYGNGKDGIVEFSEKACQKGKLGKIRQLKLMEKILDEC